MARPAAALLLCAVPIAAAAHPRATIVWTDAAALLRNTGWNASVPKPPYGRLPFSAKTGEWCSPPCPVRDIVWGEGLNGAGLYLGFRSNASELWLNATLLNPINEATNCAATCGSGLDMCVQLLSLETFLRSLKISPPLKIYI